MVTGIALMALQPFSPPSDMPDVVDGPSFSCAFSGAGGESYDMFVRLGQGRRVGSAAHTGRMVYNYQFAAGEVRGGPAGSGAPTGESSLSGGRSGVSGGVTFAAADGDRQIVLGQWGAPGANGGIQSDLRRTRNFQIEVIARGECLFAPGSRWSPPYPESPR